jgi:sucrose phosphorylase
MSAGRRELLALLYPPKVADRVAADVERLVAAHATGAPRAGGWDERDAWLISYPDQLTRPGEPPLATLRDVMAEKFEPWLNGVHVTPFFPWTSDDGFSVTDYLAVDARYGGWADVEALATGRRLVVDAVINHLSAQSDWFRRFLAGDPQVRGFFRTADPEADLSATVRPRAHPLLTRFEGAGGPVWAWTTFSPDQVDLDYRTPELLLRVLEVLLTYVRRGAAVLRLDAIAFLWKEEGTTSINLPQTHALIRLIRSCVEAVDPSVLILSETNVPHEENVAYLGSAEEPQAHLAYQFALPPLTLHAVLTGEASRLRAWAAALEPPPPGTSFLNFLASHDGIGLRPVEGILESGDVDVLVGATARGGGAVSRRALAGGGSAVYELNTTWYSAVGAGYSAEAALRRHLASHAIMLALRGIPALYVQSLVAGENDHAGYARSGQPRALNRRRFDDVDALQDALGSPATPAGAAWRGLRRMLAWRAATPAFHPESAQTVLDAPREVLGVERAAPTGERARVYVNVSSHQVPVEVEPSAGWAGFDGRPVDATFELAPWSSHWLRADGNA